MKVKLLTAATLILINPISFADETPSAPSATYVPADSSTKTSDDPKVSGDFLGTTDTGSTDGTENKEVAISPEKIDCEYKFDASAEIKNENVIIWSEKAAVQSFNYNSDNVDSKLKDLKSCFTDQGYKSYTDALSKSGNVEAIKSQKLNVSSLVDGSTKINKLEDNKWQLKVPLQVVYQNDQEKLTQLLFIDMLVSRKVSGELGILQIIAAPRDKMVDKKPDTAKQ